MTPAGVYLNTKSMQVFKHKIWKMGQIKLLFLSLEQNCHPIWHFPRDKFDALTKIQSVPETRSGLVWEIQAPVKVGERVDTRRAPT